jgi:hypothetical protein
MVITGVPAPAVRRFDPAIPLAIILAIFSVLSMWHRSEQCFGLDFYQFWVVGQEISKPAPAAIYSDTWRINIGEQYWQRAHSRPGYRHEVGASDMRRTLQTYSTPLLYSFVSLISTHDYDQSLKHYQFFSFACGIAAIVIICRVLRFSWPTTLLIIAAMFGWGEAFLSEVFCANVNQVQLFSIACLIWIETRRDAEPKMFGDVAGGVLLALIVLFKPNTLAVAGLLGLMWLLQQRYDKLIRHAIPFVITVIVVIALTSWRVGSSDCWLKWFGAVHQLEMETMSPQGENYSLAAVALARIGYAAARIVTVLVPLIPLVIFAFRRSGQNTKQTTRAIAIGTALSLLASPFAWLHYFALVTPLLLVALRPIDANDTTAENRFWFRLRIALGILSLALICSSPVTNNLLGRYPFYAGTFYGRSIRMAGVTTLLFAFALIEFWRDSLPGWPSLSLNLFSRRTAHAAS